MKMEFVDEEDNTHHEHVGEEEWEGEGEGEEPGQEEWVVCERETSLSFIKITQSLIY